MGTLIGHVAPGLGFIWLGAWHLFCHTKLYVQKPTSYRSKPWFPTSTMRYLELILILVGSFSSIAMELFIGPSKHHPLDTDGTIPTNHLHNFEHSAISMTFLIFAAFSILLDRARPAAEYGMSQLLGALAFAQQLFLFHLHSADHIGVEGQYHLLLQIVVAVSFVTTLLGIPYRRSFLVSFVRSSSILFQGVWFVLMGFMLWTPSLIPKGCFVNAEVGHEVVRCSDERSLHRARSLVNIQFSWYLSFITVGIMLFYLAIEKLYGDKSRYAYVIGEDLDFSDSEPYKRTEIGFAQMEAQALSSSQVNVER